MSDLPENTVDSLNNIESLTNMTSLDINTTTGIITDSILTSKITTDNIISLNNYIRQDSSPSSNTIKTKITTTPTETISPDKKITEVVDTESSISTEDKKNDSNDKNENKVEVKDDKTKEESNGNKSKEKEKDEEQLLLNEALKQKRENHNALERKRRIYQKSKLEELKIRLPPLSSKKPSTITIMCKAIDSISKSSSSLNKSSSVVIESTSNSKKISPTVKASSTLKVTSSKISSSGKALKASYMLKDKSQNTQISEIEVDVHQPIKKQKFNKPNTVIDHSNDILMNIENSELSKQQKVTSKKKENEENKSINQSASFSNNKLVAQIDNKNISSSNNNTSDIESIDMAKINILNNMVTPSEESSLSNKDINLNLMKDNTLISSNNDLSTSITDSKLLENTNQNKSIEIQTGLDPNNIKLLNQIMNTTNKSLNLNINESINVENSNVALTTNNTNIKIPPSDGLVIPTNLSSIPPNLNQNVNDLSLQYSNDLEAIPISTPPESTDILNNHTTLHRGPTIQELSPVQVNNSNNKQSTTLILQPPTSSSTLTPAQTPIQSPSQASINVPINSINRTLSSSLKISTKHNSLPMQSQVSPINPSPINPSPLMALHQSIPQYAIGHASTATLNNSQNSQSLYSSTTLTGYQRAKSYPIQQSPHISFQNQVSPLNPAKLDPSSKVIQMTSPIGINIQNTQSVQNIQNAQHVQHVSNISNVADITGISNVSNIPNVSNISNLSNIPNIANVQDIPNQGIINIPPSANIQVQMANSTLASPNTFNQSQYYKQVNNIPTLNTYGNTNNSIQLVPQSMINQNILNPQIPKTIHNPSQSNQHQTNLVNPTNPNNIVYYY
ncbi:hypothetical protein H8356DRAFT_1039863 [Neocallimastix lanati (nom. inval.)]|nr:hypothetical protein H8356DRAFT_1039863 [Neocallimastix sp. JGI-2020a]